MLIFNTSRMSCESQVAIEERHRAPQCHEAETKKKSLADPNSFSDLRAGLGESIVAFILSMAMSTKWPMVFS